MLLIFLVSIWSLAFFVSRSLHAGMAQVLGEAQFSTVSILAKEVNQELSDRLGALQTKAEQMKPALLAQPAQIQKQLEESPVLLSLFNGGLFVTGLDGTAIADMPRSAGRIGVNYMDRQSIAVPLNEGRAVIGRPALGKKLQAPIFSIVVPIRNQQGQVVGALAGTINLGLPNFLEHITNTPYGKSGGYLIVSPRDRLIVTASNKSRIMTEIPAPSPSNGMTNRFIDGYEGFEVMVNSQGEQVLGSAKVIPVAGWYLGAALPVTEAFAPVLNMQRRLLLATLMLTILVGVLCWWVLRRQLMPLQVASNALKLMANKNQALQALPITHQDEVGELVSGLNQLIEVVDGRTRELAQAHENTFMLVKHAPMSIAIFDCSMNYLATSDRWLVEYGAGQADLVGQNHYQVLPDMPPAWRQVHQQALAGQTISNDKDMWCRADGSKVWQRWAVVPWKHPDGDAGGVIISVEDITERVTADAALHDSELRLKLALDGGELAMWDWHIPSSGLIFNARWAGILGFTQAELPPRLESWQARICPDDLMAIRRSLDAHFSGKTPIYEAEYRVQHKEGHWVWVHAKGKVVDWDAAGNPVRALGTAFDISQRKQEAERLQQAQAEADKANNAKSRFLAAASHDLHQPLAALSLYTGLLQNAATTADPKLVANMQACIDNLSELLTDLLNLSKLDAGVVTPNIGHFSIADMFASLQSVHAPEAQLKGLRLRFVPTVLTGCTDLLLLRRTLGNLIDNALRYTERGGVLVACRQRLGKTWVEVWDTGIGIAPDQTEVIFEEFKQLAYPDRNHGSGLGLAIVAKTAALLGLEVSVRSRPGRGSVFAIELALGLPDLVPQAAPANKPLLPRPLQIALVDDNPLVREALGLILQRIGHQVLACDCLGELLTELDRFQPDIVLTDYRLTGGETGYDVIAAVRKRLGARFPVILITGDTDPKLLRSMSERGVVVLHKSLNLGILQATLQALTHA